MAAIHFIQSIIPVVNTEKNFLQNALLKSDLEPYQRIGIYKALGQLTKEEDHSEKIHQIICNFLNISCSHFLRTSEYKQTLAFIRKRMKTLVFKSGADIECIHKNVSRCFKLFIERVIQDSLTLCGNPPQNCEYTFIGLGSLARREMTPYSDLEYAILVSRKLETKEIDFFKKVAAVIQFQILCLGETPLTELNIDSNNRKVIKKGFSLDGPLGKMAPNWDPELIGTPQALTHFQREEKLKEKRILPGELRNVIMFHGKKSLFDRYAHLLKKALSESQRQQRALNILRADADRFDIRIGKLEHHGRVLPVKYDLYRFLQLRIEGLSLYFGIQPTDLWNRIRKLRKMNVFSEEGASKLLEVTNRVLKLRTTIYLKEDCATEEMPIEQIERSDPEVLSNIYPTLIAFGNEIEFFIDSDGKDQTSLQKTFDCEDNYAKGFLAERKREFNRANDYFKQAQEIANENALKIEILNLMGNCLCAEGKLSEAQRGYESAFDLIYKSDLADLKIIKCYMMTLSNLAEVYIKQLCFYEAEILLKEAICVGLDYFQNMPYNAILYSNLGSLYSSKRDYQTAAENFEKARNCQEKLEKNHPRTALNLYNKGESFYQIGKENHKEALDAFDEAIKIAIKINGHLDLFHAHALKGKGLVYFDQALSFLEQKSKKNYDTKIKEAQKFQEDAHAIYEQTSLENADERITQYCNLGIIYASSNMLKMIDYFEKAKQLINNRVPNDRLWKDFYSQQGLAYHHAGLLSADIENQLKHYQKSCAFYKEALRYWQKEPHEEAFFESAFRYHNYGTTLFFWGSQIASEINQQLCKDSNVLKTVWSKIKLVRKVFEAAEQQFKIAIGEYNSVGSLDKRKKETAELLQNLMHKWRRFERNLVNFFLR